MERETGIEPATSSLGSWHSTAELLPLGRQILHQLLSLRNWAVKKESRFFGGFECERDAVRIVKLSKNGLQKIDQFMPEDRHLMCAFIFFPMMRHFGRLKTIGKDAGTSTHIFHIAAANPNQIIVRSGTLRQPPCHTAPLHFARCIGQNRRYIIDVFNAHSFNSSNGRIHRFSFLLPPTSSRSRDSS